MTIYPNIAGIDYESCTDGKGVRTAIYLSGCSHHCLSCHNPETHDPSYGKSITDEVISQIAERINNMPHLTGITLTGGDPFYDPEKTARFLYVLLPRLNRSPDIWCYTGYTWEQLAGMTKQNKYANLLLSTIDVIVDGEFVQTLADKRLPFAGSSNQRIIDVKQSLLSYSVVEYSEF